MSALLLGAGFGWFLERGGMASARRVAGQFYLADMALLKLMFSAIVTAMLGVFWLARLGALELGALYLPPTYLVPQAVGGLVFGAGFLLGGLCPGTACVAAVAGRADGLAVVLGMLTGTLLFQVAFPLVARFYESTPRGALTLPQLLGLGYARVVFVVTALALVAFAAAAWWERRASATPGAG